MNKFIPIHKHLLIKCFISEPIESQYLAQTFLSNIVTAIGMKAVTIPQAVYVADLGNEGFTGSINLATSHIAFHCWDVEGLLMLDVYSCKCFDSTIVIDMITKYFGEIKSINIMEIDRQTMEVIK